MATISKVFATQQQIEGAADAYTTLSGTTEEYSSDVDLETSGHEGAHVRVEINFDATPTDNVVCNIYGSLDGTNYDDTPIYSIELDQNTDPNQISLVVKDVAHFRVGLVQTGSTDSHDVRVYVQRWNWQSV